MARKTGTLSIYNVRYFCTFSRRDYTQSISAGSAQEAVDTCRAMQEVGGVLIRIVEVSQVVNDWN